MSLASAFLSSDNLSAPVMESLSAIQATDELPTTMLETPRPRNTLDAAKSIRRL